MISSFQATIVIPSFFLCPWIDGNHRNAKVEHMKFHSNSNKASKLLHRAAKIWSVKWQLTVRGKDLRVLVVPLVELRNDH